MFSIRGHITQWIVITVMVIVPMLTAVSSTASQPLCLDGKVWDDDQGVCVPLDESAATPAMADTELTPTPSSTTDPATGFWWLWDEDGPFGFEPKVDLFEVTSFLCPPGPDSGTLSTDRIAYDTCTERPASYSVTLSIDGVPIGTRSATAADYAAMFDAPPGGDYTVIPGAIEGYAFVSAFCRPTSGEARNQVVFKQASGGAFYLDNLPEGGMTECAAYYLPLPALVTIDVRSFTCVADFDVQTAGSYDDLRQYCGLASNPVYEISVLASNGVTTGTTAKGIYSTGATIPAGDVSIRQVANASPLVLCSGVHRDGSIVLDRDVQFVDEDGWVQLRDVRANETYLCEWFNPTS